MLKVNIRELRKNLAKYMGMNLIVTKRGKNLATITPIEGYVANKQVEKFNNK